MFFDQCNPYILHTFRRACPSPSEINRFIYPYFIFKTLFLILNYVLRIYRHQQISSPTPNCIFFLGPCIYAAPYSPYTCTPLPMSLHLYNDYATEFITFWTTQNQQIYLLLLPQLETFLLDYTVTFFLYFLKTDNVSGYIMTPVITEALYDNHLSTYTTTTVMRHTIQHLL